MLQLGIYFCFFLHLCKFVEIVYLCQGLNDKTQKKRTTLEQLWEKP